MKKICVKCIRGKRMLKILDFFFNDVGHFMMLVFLLCVVTYSVVVIIESSKWNRK